MSSSSSAPMTHWLLWLRLLWLRCGSGSQFLKVKVVYSVDHHHHHPTGSGQCGSPERPEPPEDPAHGLRKRGRYNTPGPLAASMHRADTVIAIAIYI